MRRARVIFRGDRLTATAEGQGLRLDDGRYVAEEEVTWLPPVEPRTIFAVGLNYAKHARELAFAPTAGTAGVPQGTERRRRSPRVHGPAR